MKKLLIAASLCLPVCLCLPACSKKCDYFEYVSEYRRGVYYYEEDGFELKIHCSLRETPYYLDGIKGDVSAITEVFYYPDETPKEVEIDVNGHTGEMSYIATTRSFYLSFSSEDFGTANVKVKLNVDGKESEFSAANVSEEGVIDGKTALKCVTEYDGEAFSSLTEWRTFKGEISVRLLYDEGCYYYVGVCDREKNVHAYLIDGKDGRVIAEKQNKA